MLRIREGIKYDFDDVLIVPQRSALESRSQVDLVRRFTFPHSKIELECVPIIAANMSTVGTFAMAKAFANEKMLVALHKHYSVDQLVHFFEEHPLNTAKDYVFYTVGSSNNDFEKLKKLQISLGKEFPKLLCIDVANGYLESFTKVVKKYRSLLPNSVIMAGNVVTSNMAEELILSGADIVKVGIGSGSVCTTRIKTGVGWPQLSATSECAFAVHGKPDGHICSDGGCNNTGDIAKAFAAGADFVMVGGLVSGCDECEGEWIEENGTKYLKFFGMSSKDAQEQFNGGLSSYKASEGKTVKVPSKGPVSEILQDIAGGVRSACTYVGAKRLKDLPKCSEFIHVTKTHNTVFGVSK